MADLKPFKISDLKPYMDQEDVSDDDLLLVSDAGNPKNGKKYQSRALEIGTLQDSMQDKLTPKIKNSVEEDFGGKYSVQKLQNFVENFIVDDPSSIELTIDCGDSER